MNSGALVAVTPSRAQPANATDTQIVQETLSHATEHISVVAEVINAEAGEPVVSAAEPAELVMDKGYQQP